MPGPVIVPEPLPAVETLSVRGGGVTVTIPLPVACCPSGLVMVTSLTPAGAAVVLRLRVTWVGSV